MRSIVEEALDTGFQSVMIDGSRVPLERNIAVTREIVELAHAAGVPVEGEVGAIRQGIAKINIGTQVRQAYEKNRRESEQAAQDAVYETVVRLLTKELQVAGTAERLKQAHYIER